MFGKKQSKKTDQITGSIEKRERRKGGAILAALISSIAVFAVMLQLEKNVLEQYERREVTVTVTAIPAGQLITEENVKEYFTVKQFDVECIPEMAVDGTEELIGKIVNGEIAEGSVLTRVMFSSPEDLIGKMKNPVVAGVRVEDIFQMVGGRLRTGDIVSAVCVSDEEDTRTIWENLLVYEAFDQSGNRIDNSDNSTPVSRINLLIEKEDVEQFYTDLASGNIRIVKEYR